MHPSTVKLIKESKDQIQSCTEKNAFQRKEFVESIFATKRHITHFKLDLGKKTKFLQDLIAIYSVRREHIDQRILIQHLIERIVHLNHDIDVALERVD